MIPGITNMKKSQLFPGSRGSCLYVTSEHWRNRELVDTEENGTELEGTRTYSISD